MAFKIIEKSKELPVSMELVKSYLRIQHGEEDALLQHLIRAGCEWVQESTGKSLLRQTCQMTHNNAVVHLPYGPVLKILEVTMHGKNLKPEDYVLEQGVLYVANPPRRKKRAMMSVTYEAGLSESPEELPEAIRNAILTTIAYLYENRDNAAPKVNLNEAMKPWIQYHGDYHLA